MGLAQIFLRLRSAKEQMHLLFPFLEGRSRIALMSDFKQEEVAKLAKLARLKLSPAEEKEIAKEITSILSYVSTISKLRGEEEKERGVLRNVMREDGSPHESGLYRDALLAAAPQREGDHIAVKKIISK